MNVKVIAEKWGRHRKGDVIPNMPESTAKALMFHGLVEEDGKSKDVKPKKDKE